MLQCREEAFTVLTIARSPFAIGNGGCHAAMLPCCHVGPGIAARCSKRPQGPGSGVGTTYQVYK